jgi:hypothetical protein
MIHERSVLTVFCGYDSSTCFLGLLIPQSRSVSKLVLNLLNIRALEVGTLKLLLLELRESFLDHVPHMLLIGWVFDTVLFSFQDVCELSE